MLPFHDYLPLATSCPAIVAVGLGLWRHATATTRNDQASKRGLGLVRLIGVLTRNNDRARRCMEILRLSCDNPAAIPSYLDPPPQPPDDHPSDLSSCG
jgi:hypothetical protein